MYLIDTNVISEARKNNRANSGVIQFFVQASEEKESLFISVVTVGEIRRGVEAIRHRGDEVQASLLEKWLQTVLDAYGNGVLNFTEVEAQVWGRLRGRQPQNAIDKQIAATALTCGLTLVTRNTKDFLDTGVALLNPFA